MKFKILDDKQKETYDIGYKVGNRQIIITDIEWENETEHKLYRKGYMAGLMDYKRNNNVSFVSNVSNVNNVEIETPTTPKTPTTPISISISKDNSKYIDNINIPDWLLRTDSYDELTSVQIGIYDNPEMRELLNQLWAGKEVKSQIGELYLQILTQKMQKKDKFIKPTLDEWLKFTTERGLDSTKMKKAWESYDIANWSDSKGNKIKNWKQKIIQVWDKPDNKPKSGARGFEEDNPNTFLKSTTEY